MEKEIKAIINGKGSKAVKNEMLIKMGIRKQELPILFEMYAEPKVAKARAARLAYTFGVEIECFNVRRENVINAFAEVGLNTNNITNYCCAHNADSKTAYKLVPDGSIHGENALEVVTPVLNGIRDGFKSLEKCCKQLNAMGAKVNKSTGLHVHIGGNITEEQYANVFVNYAYLERVIDLFMPQSRRASNNGYCLSLVNYADRLANCHSVGDVNRLFSTRYMKVNPMSWARHKTIEFRQHSGTTDFTKIQNWVRFCAKLVAWSKNNRLTDFVTSVNEIPFLTKGEKDFFNGRVEELNR